MSRPTLRLIAILIFSLSVLSCSSTDTGERGTSGDSPLTDHEYYRQFTEVTVYFRNTGYNPDGLDDKQLLPVTRSILKTEAMARSVVRELMRGPVDSEIEQYGVAPVINLDASIEDIYVLGGICVIHLSCNTPLSIPGDSSVYEDEQVMVGALVRSLTAMDRIDAVWLFQNGSPWQGSTIGWCSPLAPEGDKVTYNIYIPGSGNYYPETMNYEEPLLETVSVSIKSPLGTTPENCPFVTIVNRLTWGYDKSISGFHGSEANEISLSNGLLKLDLCGEATILRHEMTAVYKALVYTFTALSEIDWLMITVDGEYWDDSLKVWDYPLNRDDFK